MVGYGVGWVAPAVGSKIGHAEGVPQENEPSIPNVATKPPTTKPQLACL